MTKQTDKESEYSSKSAHSVSFTEHRRNKRRARVNGTANFVVSCGGVFVIVCIIAILLVILYEAYPLFKAPEISKEAQKSAPLEETELLLVGVDEYLETSFALSNSGLITFLAPDRSIMEQGAKLKALGDSRLLFGYKVQKGRYLAATDDGRILPFEIEYISDYQNDRRVIKPQLAERDPIVVNPEKQEGISLLAADWTDKRFLAAGSYQDGSSFVYEKKIKKSLIGEAKETERFWEANPFGSDAVTAAVVNLAEEKLIFGSAGGAFAVFDLNEDDFSRPQILVPSANDTKAAISKLRFLLGDRTLIAGDSAGGVSSWTFLREEKSGAETLKKVHSFLSHHSPIIEIDASTRNKSFVTLDKKGTLFLHYAASGSTLLEHDTNISPLSAASLAPKGDGLVIADKLGRLHYWKIENPHPEASAKTLFSKVSYEGYDEAQYMWQSTGATDEFEPKFSVVPLIVGTLKGTFYALLFAIPLAILGALYTSQFMHPGLKAIVKPTIELMAALPSVVIGFIAGLWLAPIVEPYIVGVIIVPLILALVISIIHIFWMKIPNAIRSTWKTGSEMFVLVPGTVFGIYLSLLTGEAIEAQLLAGDYRQWLYQTFSIIYDQRNSIIVGIAMGFAVIPIIFTIAEDAISSVPRQLSAASLALGASKWQTAAKIVLPAASPGIFSAIMIGFGRAVGETMIVLMATGNTPIMSWSALNGFRALSANIAVELPEAPHGATLYRILFLSALLLFAMTFVVNTLTEIVRVRIRRKYQRL